MRWVSTRVFPGTRSGEDQDRAVRLFDSSPLNVVEKFGLDNHRVYLRQTGEFRL